MKMLAVSQAHPYVYGFARATQFRVIAGSSTSASRTVRDQVDYLARQSAIAASHGDSVLALGRRRRRLEVVTIVIPSSIAEADSDRRGLSLVLALACEGPRGVPLVQASLLEYMVFLMSWALRKPGCSARHCSDEYTATLQEGANEQKLRRLNEVIVWLDRLLGSGPLSLPAPSSGPSNLLGGVAEASIGQLVLPLIRGVRATRRPQISYQLQPGSHFPDQVSTSAIYGSCPVVVHDL